MISLLAVKSKQQPVSAWVPERLNGTDCKSGDSWVQIPPHALKDDYSKLHNHLTFNQTTIMFILLCPDVGTVDMGVLEAPAEWCGGSNPPLGTTTHGSSLCC